MLPLGVGSGVDVVRKLVAVGVARHHHAGHPTVGRVRVRPVDSRIETAQIALEVRADLDNRSQPAVLVRVLGRLVLHPEVQPQVLSLVGGKIDLRKRSQEARPVEIGRTGAAGPGREFTRRVLRRVARIHQVVSVAASVVAHVVGGAFEVPLSDCRVGRSISGRKDQDRQDAQERKEPRAAL